MEPCGLVHCNLNPANLVVKLSNPAQPVVHLVDLENMAFSAAAFPEGFQTGDPGLALTQEEPLD
jgi:cobyrinic acid a,c-diamide synthase